MTFTIQLIKPTAKQSGVDFGAIIEDLDLETITRKEILKNPFYFMIFTLFLFFFFCSRGL